VVTKPPAASPRATRSALRSCRRSRPTLSARVHQFRSNGHYFDTT
jgi:hypothetical protein